MYYYLFSYKNQIECNKENFLSNFHTEYKHRYIHKHYWYYITLNQDVISLLKIVKKLELAPLLQSLRELIDDNFVYDAYEFI